MRKKAPVVIPMKNDEIKTQSYVLRRTNYGEADRILNLITPEGKIAVMAKGVRKAKSKMAGGVEMFTLSEINVHRGKSEIMTLTGVKMVRHYGEIVKDLARMELAGMILGRVNALAPEGAATPEYFRIVDEGLFAINAGADLGVVEAWAILNLLRAAGEEVNLYRDASGARLVAEGRYDWDNMEKAFCLREGGKFGAEEIKMMRLMVSSKLLVATRVVGYEKWIAKILSLCRIMI